MIVDEIISAALLGTRSSPVRLLTLPDEIAAILPPQSYTPELRLLDIAASLTLYSLAGVEVCQGIAPPKKCAANHRVECSARAAAIMEQAFDSRLQPLLLEWLELAQAANRCPPHFLLPKLLGAAAANNSLQPLVSAVIDERGHWLTQFNQKWKFTSQSLNPDDDAWQTGNSQQRRELLQIIRQRNPQRARELIAATWQADSVDDRALWLRNLLLNLSEHDEAFLESCLDDRSSRVRETAADLLARLPDSKFVARMIARLRPLLSFTRGTIGQPPKGKRATPPSLSVCLPEAFDKSMQRDGMSEKSKETIGQKQWWLLQMVASVPLAFWGGECGVAPAMVVSAVPSEYANVFIRGWLTALSRTPIPEWIEPLLAAAKSGIHIDEEVLRSVPPPQRIGVLQTLLRISGPNALELPKLLAAWRQLDERVSQLLLSAVGPDVIVLCDAHFYLHPHTLPTLEAKLTNQDAAENHRRVDQALSIISLRCELHKEFST